MDFLKFIAPFYLIGIPVAFLLSLFLSWSFGYSEDVSFLVSMALGGLVPTALMLAWMTWFDS